MSDFRQSSRLSQGLSVIADALSARLPETELGGPALAGGIGLGHLIVATWNLERETVAFGVEPGPFVAFLLIAGPGIVTCWLASRLLDSPFDVEKRWLVAWGGVTGSVLFGVVIYVSILVRLAEGRVVSEPVFVLGLTSGIGAVTGLVVGEMYARALQSASVANRRRDQLEFMNRILRHDVLNSMTVIRTRADILAAETDGRDREFAEAILEHTTNVVDLTERIKSMISALDAEGTVDREPTALAPIVENQVGPFRTSHGDITFAVDVGDVTVLADDLLEEVVGNLLDNAVEHGTDGSEPARISVTATRTDGRVQLRVADTGPGVPDGLADEVFERGTSETGSGFGLFFVRTMVDHYGGSVWVEDNDPTGAVFVVELAAA